MEYESRKVKWYWMLAFILFCGGVVYLLLTGNPYLYSHQELRSALIESDTDFLQTFPSRPQAQTNIGNPTFFPRYHQERTATDPLASPRSRSYEEIERFPVAETFDGMDTQSVASDESGFYLSGKSPWAVCIGLDGSIRWKYRFLELASERSLSPILVDEANAYLLHPNGRLVSLDKRSGRLRWLLDLRREVAAAPFLWQKNLAVPVKRADGGIQLIFVHRADGQAEKVSPHLDLKRGFTLSFAPELDGAVIATIDNKVISISPDNWEIVWSQTLTDPVKGAAVIVDSQIYVATMGAKIVKLDGAKRGKLEWEADLVKPAAGPPAYLPIVGKLSVLDTSGALSAIEAKTGKVVWRTAGENHNPLGETWSARLKGQNIEEFKMDWLHKGWTIWAPCADRHFCIYTPGKGQLIQKVQLSGALLALPLALPHSWVFLIQSKPGHYIVSRTLEESEIKRMHADTIKKQEKIHD